MIEQQSIDDDFSTEENDKVSQLKIYLCDPCCFWKTIIVNNSIQIFNLVKIVCKNNNYSYVYHGTIVSGESTLKSIGIRNDEVILIIKNQKDQKNIIDHKWIRLSMDQLFERKLKILSNDFIKNEYNRLSDIKNLKVEGNLKLYKKQAHKFYNQNEENFVKKEINFSQFPQYQPPEAPCTDAMPILW